MAEILVLGAGLTGLTTAMLLARDGHDVTVLERDAAEPPAPGGAAWTGWDRAGVAQFRQLHLMLPRWREVMETELPGVLDARGQVADGQRRREVPLHVGHRPTDSPIQARFAHAREHFKDPANMLTRASMICLLV